MIEIKNISVTYDRVLYENQNILLKPGEITLLEGESGAGKSTLIYIIGMLLKNNCDYFVDNKNVNADLYKRNISFVMQSNDLIDYLTVEEHFNLSNNAKPKSKELIQEILDYVDLEISFNQTINTLSTGERQRLAIAIALSNNTPILLLDEPTAYLDNERSLAIMSLLKKIAKEGKTVVIASHDAITKEFADRIYRIKDQQIKKVKDSNTSDSTSLEHNEANNHYYLTYIKYYIKHHLFPIVLNIALLALCTTFLVLTSSIVDHFLDQQDQNLQDLSNNQILAVNSDKSSFDETAPLLDETTLNNIQAIDGVSRIDPYVQTTINNGLVDITVCSYADKSSLEDHVDIDFESDSDYFISDALYRVIKQDQLELNSEEYPINGVLKKGYNASYEIENHYILYVPTNFLKATSGNYIISIDDYKKISSISNQLESNYSLTVKSKDNNSVLLDSYNLASTIGNIASVVLLVISTIFLLVINYQTIKNQSHSFAYLKVNDPNYQKIELLHLLLILIKNIFVWFSFVFIQFLYIFIINCIYDIHITYFTDFFYSYRLTFILTLLVSLPTIYKIHFNNPIKELR